MGDMGNIRVKHEGGDKASRPTSGATHKEQKPGNADGTPASKMTWKGCSMDASKKSHMKK